MIRANIFQLELHIRLQSLLWWVLGIAAVHLLYLAVYPSFASQAAILHESLKQFPKELLQAFGMDRVNMATVEGYYAVIFLITQVLLAIQASSYGVDLLSREESERTADFLLTKPVSRTQVFMTKLSAALVTLLLTEAVVWICAFGGWALFNAGHPYDPSLLALLVSSALPFQLFFLGVGLAISLMVRLVRSATPYALALGLGMYVLSSLGSLPGEIKLEWVTPFRYFDAPTLVASKAYDLRFLLLDVTVTILALAFACWRYLRRDIPAVS